MAIHYLAASKTVRYAKINGEFIDLLQAKLKIDWLSEFALSDND